MSIHSINKSLSHSSKLIEEKHEYKYMCLFCKSIVLILIYEFTIEIDKLSLIERDESVNFDFFSMICFDAGYNFKNTACASHQYKTLKINLINVSKCLF